MLMDERVRGILEREFKLTMGCTDPGAVAYAASKAASLLDGELEAIDVVLSKNIYKNAVFVGIPVIKKAGIEYAALLGAMVHKPELKLAVLSEVTGEMAESLGEYAKRIPVAVECSDIDEPLYIAVTCKSAISSVTVAIKGDYDWICSILKDGKLLYQKEPSGSTADTFFGDLRFRDLFAMAVNEKNDDCSLLEYEKINRDAVFAVISDDLKQYLDRLESGDGFSINGIAGMARMYVLSASRLRMSGETVPIVSLAGSGNHGIVTLLTVSAVCDALRVERTERIKALYLAALTAVYIKSRMNRLTVMCGTAIAGAAGGAAAVSLLLGGGCQEAEHAVNTVLGTIGGMLCDGAKESCAFKVGMAAECAVTSGYMAVKHMGIKPGSGIITDSIDDNIQYMGHINNTGMKEADNIMWKILGSQKRCGINTAK
jgi:L-cysteine desulfidase